MLIRLHSDLHTEFFPLSKPEMLDDLIPSIKGEEDMVLVLAGDIIAEVDGWKNSALDIYTPWIKDLSQRHKAIIYIAGNHEGYYSSFQTAFEFLDNLDSKLDNFHFLNNDVKVIDDVRFLGTTLWTPLDGPLDMFYIQDMNDVDVIRNWHYQAWRDAYQQARYFLESTLPQPHDGKTVVVTHHAPSFESIMDAYKGDVLNMAYASNQTELMFDNDIALWCHGHVHNTNDYIAGGGETKTRVVSNPHGYYNKEHNEYVNAQYKPSLVIEV